MESKEIKEIKKNAKTTSENKGLAESWVGLAAGVASKGVDTGLGVVNDVRGELFQRVSSVIDLVEGAQQGQIKLARSLKDRADQLTGGALDAIEQALLDVVATARSAGEGAAAIAAQSAQSLTSRQIRKAA